MAESSNFGRFVATVEMGESLDFLQKIIAYLNSVYVTIWTRENEGFIPNGTAKTLRKNVYSRLGVFLLFLKISWTKSFLRTNLRVIIFSD